MVLLLVLVVHLVDAARPPVVTDPLEFLRWFATVANRSRATSER
jgi:hypothetical protein